MSTFFAIPPSMPPPIPDSFHLSKEVISAPYQIPDFRPSYDYFSPSTPTHKFEEDAAQFALSYQSALQQFISKIESRPVSVSRENLNHYLNRYFIIEGLADFNEAIIRTYDEILSTSVGLYLIERLYDQKCQLIIRPGSYCFFDSQTRYLSIDLDSISHCNQVNIDDSGAIIGKRCNTLGEVLIHEFTHALQLCENRLEERALHPLFINSFEQEANFWQNGHRFLMNRTPLFCLFPLHYEDYLTYKEGQKPLLHFGITREIDLNLSYIDCLLKEGHIMDVQNCQGETFLHLWCTQGLVEQKTWDNLYRLLYRGSSLYIEDVQKTTPFSRLMQFHEKLAIELLSYLIAHGHPPPLREWSRLSDEWIQSNKSPWFQQHYFALRQAAHLQIGI